MNVPLAPITVPLTRAEANALVRGRPIGGWTPRPSKALCSAHDKLLAAIAQAFQEPERRS